MKAITQYGSLTVLLLAIACGDKGNDANDNGAGGAESTHPGQGGEEASLPGQGGNGNSLSAGGGKGGRTGNSGGDGNVCDKIQLETTSTPPRVVFVQDLSSSMVGEWQPLDDAMVALAEEFGDRIQLGLIPFSTVFLDYADEIRQRYEAGDDEAWFDEFFAEHDNDCDISDSAVIAPALGNAPKVIAAYDQVIERRMVGGTPTFAAMQKTREVLIEDAPDDGSSAYAILVTDGEPNCPSRTSDRIGDVEDEIAGLAADGVDTYVVGYEYNGSALDAWAAAGNTTSYYEADGTETLNDAISEILIGLLPCEYALSNAVEDAKYVRVTVDGKDRPLNNAANGWKLNSDARTVILTGKACSDLRTDGKHSIDVVVECSQVDVIL